MRRVYRDGNIAPVPELPEIQAIVEGLDRAVTGRRIDSATAWHPSVVKSADPGIAALEGGEITGLWRRGKLIGIDVGPLAVVIHLMQAGRLGLAAPSARRPPRTVALSLRLDDGRELRLREAGTEHRASVHVLARDALASHPPLAALGPEPIGLDPAVWRERLTSPPGRLQNALREGRRVAGIGRAYASDIMWAARLPPLTTTTRLDDAQWAALARAADTVLSQALERARADIDVDMPSNERRVTAVHGHAGDPCLRCGDTLERVSYEGYELVYCPDCQTGGRVYADRRMSRLIR